MNRGASWPLTALLVSARWYRATLSPDHGWGRLLRPHGVCRFQPTCSEYFSEAVAGRGWYGIWLALCRLGRCHPFGGSGYDPPPVVRQRQ